MAHARTRSVRARDEARSHQRDAGARFFASIALFVFSMCMLVLAGNFLLMFVFWEAVGLCSYLLI